MIIGFTGTRKGMTRQQYIEVERILLEYSPGTVVHGDCIGADAEFNQIAQNINCFIVIRPSNIPSMCAHCKGRKVYPPEDPLVRNHKIVDMSHRMIACPSSKVETLRSGTWATIRYARSIGRPIEIIYPED